METIQSLPADYLSLRQSVSGISLASQSEIPPPGLHSESFIPTPCIHGRIHLQVPRLPTSSLVEADFFFVEKKDKTLCPCIDFRGLNITGKNKYYLLFLILLLDRRINPMPLLSWTCTMPITWSTSRTR